MPVSRSIPLLVALLSAGASAEQNLLIQREKPPQAVREFRKSQEAFDANRIDEAVNRLRKGIALDPSNTDAYNDLGVIFYNTGRREQAFEMFKAMVRIDPRSHRGYINLAFTHFAAAEYPEAEQAARRAVDIVSHESKGHYLLGVALLAQRKNLAEAERHLLIASAEMPQARLELCRLLIESGDWDRAKAELQPLAASRK